jgi:hypothetical protein
VTGSAEFTFETGAQPLRFLLSALDPPAIDRTWLAAVVVDGAVDSLIEIIR